MMVVYGMRLFWCCVFYCYISSTNAGGSLEKHARPAARRFHFLWYLELWVAQMCPRNDSGNRVSWIRSLAPMYSWMWYLFTGLTVVNFLSCYSCFLNPVCVLERVGDSVTSYDWNGNGWICNTHLTPSYTCVLVLLHLCNRLVSLCWWGMVLCK